MESTHSLILWVPSDAWVAVASLGTKDMGRQPITVLG